MPALTREQLAQMTPEEKHCKIAALLEWTYHADPTRLTPAYFGKPTGDGGVIPLRVDYFASVAEAVCERGFRFVLKSPFMDNSPWWFAGFTPKGMTGWNGRPDHEGHGPTAEAAVLDAALLALSAGPGELSDPVPELPDAVELILKEYGYWRNVDEGDDKDMAMTCMGAMGALSNVLAALLIRPDPRWTRPASGRPDLPREGGA